MPENTQSAKEPTLSICIPTYNRGNWLRVSLSCWLGQIKDFKDKVELVVSDNHSDDDTEKVVAQAQKTAPFSYHRNIENIGLNRNVIRVVETAKGRFVWVATDDALPRSGALKRVLDTLANNPQTEHMFINVTEKEFRYPPAGQEEVDNTPLTPTMNVLLEDKSFDKIWHLLKYDQKSCFTAIFSFICTRVLAKKLFAAGDSEEEFDSLETFSPCGVYTADHLLHKSTFYLGYPLLVNNVCRGDLAWEKYYKISVLRYFPELARRFVRNGVPACVISPIIKLYLHAGRYSLLDFLVHGAAKKERFSLALFIKMHWRYGMFYSNLLFSVRLAVKRAIKKVTLSTKKVLRGEML